MNIYTLLKKPFFGRYQKPWQWPLGVEREDWRRLEFDNGRGGTLVGLYGEATSGPARATVICAHPMGIESKGYFLRNGHARLLRAAGYNVLLFDFNGFGESPDADLLYPEDVRAAARAARGLTPGLPLLGLGVSFGSAWLICALAQEGHGLSAVVLECPFTTLEEFWRPYRLAYVVLRLITLLRPGLLARLRPIERISDMRETQAALFIYGDQDQVTPSTMGERLARVCPLLPERRSIWVVSEARHARALLAAPEAYRERLLGFLDTALASATPRLA